MGRSFIFLRIWIAAPVTCVTALLFRLNASTEGRVAKPVQDQHQARPNIILIISDDLGFDDVSFGRETQPRTPNIDAIAAGGITMNNVRVEPVCTPTRASIMTGRHSIHTGVTWVPKARSAWHLDLTFPILPAFLKELGYATHLVGKWQLGYNIKAALPTSRGFDTFYGFWEVGGDYFNHSNDGVYDFVEGTRTAYEAAGTHSTTLFSHRAVEIIQKSTPSQPFFLCLTYQSPHDPYSVPDVYQGQAGRIRGHERPIYNGLVISMDEGIGNVTRALKQKGIYESSLLIFTSDNGGGVSQEHGLQGSNYPMRGGKWSYWEGGTRTIGIVHGAGLPISLKGSVSHAKVHCADFLPTILHVASGSPTWLDENLPDTAPRFLLGDGQDFWDALMQNTEFREEVLLHSDDRFAQALLSGDWKLIRNIHFESPASVWETRSRSSRGIAFCGPGGPPPSHGSTCTDDFCLFNITADPCEYFDVASKHPSVVSKLKDRLQHFEQTRTQSSPSTDCEPVVVNGAARPCDDQF